jgi:hypothetical protein
VQGGRLVCVDGNSDMQLSQESRGSRWLILLATWIGCALLVLLHTRAVHGYLDLLDGLGKREGTSTTTPLRHVVPARYADTQIWVRHAIAADVAETARLRFTTDDNAPKGREVHWASPLLWLIRTGAQIRDIEHVVRWLNVPLLLTLVIALSAWAALRAGAAAGVLVAAAMVGHKLFYESFQPLNVDHHGLLVACVLGLLLGLTFMGGGFWKPNLGGTFATLPPSDLATARRAAIVSAVCGAFGLWISAASVLPAIAIAGVAGLIAALWRGESALRDGGRFEPQVWRLWGQVGGGLSCLFYLVEYAPANIDLRLEVNHPLYGLAWWGGAELVGNFSAAFLERARPLRRRLLLRSLLPMLAVAAVPTVMALGGEKVFSLRDPFIADLRHFVLEGKSLPAIIDSLGVAAVGYQLASIALLIPAVVLAWRARGEGATLLGFVTLIAAAFIALGFWEVRWWSIAAAAQIVLLLVVIASVRRRWTWVLATCLVVFVPTALQRVAATRFAVKSSVIDERDILQPLYRDIASALRATQPEGDITLLASPNASVGIGYYGNFRTIGTLFWENAAGLKAAATIFSARNEAEAAALVKARGITHVAMISTASFLSEYFRLLNPTAPASAAKTTFGYHLASQPGIAPWLQPIAYRPPPDLRISGASVFLFKVAFEQTEIERSYHTVAALAAAGNAIAAEATFDEALARLPADARFVFAESVGTMLYDYGADATAARTFRKALSFKSDAGVATVLAWILATTSDPKLRDGRAALALIDPVAQGDLNDPTVLSALAAALAEVGRFPDAVVMAERAVGSARGANDAAAVDLLRRRLDAYRANKAWKQ